MRRINNLIVPIADPENLRTAFWKAQKGKRYSRQVQAYRDNLENNIMGLRAQLLSGLVEVGDYRYFKVYDPKEREICASAFSEQVMHHALMNICHEYFEGYQVTESYASRPGKGVHAALKKAANFTRSHPWFLKLDVKKFFASIHHDTLKKQLWRIFKDPILLNIFEKIIDSYEADPGRGLPIGNLSSQYFANHYLAGLDHYLKEDLGCKAYVRYMDDLVLWHQDKFWLKETRESIEAYVQDQLKCWLKPDLLNRSTLGLPFVGFLLFPTHIRLSQRSKKRFIRKINELEGKYHSGELDEASCQRKALSLISFTQQADALHFRQQVLSKAKGQSL